MLPLLHAKSPVVYHRFFPSGTLYVKLVIPRLLSVKMRSGFDGVSTVLLSLV